MCYSYNELRNALHTLHKNDNVTHPTRSIRPDYLWKYGDWIDCCNLNGALDYHGDKTRRIIKHGHQRLGHLLTTEEVVQDFSLARVTRHLETTSTSVEKSLLENESPRIVYCEDNIEVEGCSSGQRVVSSEGMSVGFNSRSAEETLIDAPKIRELIRELLGHGDVM